MDVSETATGRRAAADPTSEPKDVTEAQHTRIVLLGKTGTGKSSLAGTIFGDNVFEIYHTSISGTSKCQKVTRQVDGRAITLIDTPGIFDNRSSDDTVKSEIIDTIIESSDGLDAFLILFKVGKFTQQENEVVSRIMDYFSEEAFKHAVVVFTHGDQLHDNMKIEEFVRDNKYLCDLLDKCGKRFCVVDNKYWKNNQQDEYRNNQVQVAKLLQIVKEMVKSRGRYTNEMLQEVKRMIKEEEERIGRSAVDMSVGHIRNQAKSIVSDLLKKLAGITAGMFLGAFLGVPCMVSFVISALTGKEMVAVHDGLHLAAASGIPLPVAAASGIPLPVAAAVSAAAGAVIGVCTGYDEANKADSTKEAVKNTTKAFIKPIQQAFEKLNKHMTNNEKK